MMEKNLPVGPENVYDAVIEDALRSAPLEAPPPLLYAAVMQRVRLAPQPAPPPRFRIAWLDLALSAFFASMLLAAWFALRLIPPVWISYLRNQALWSLQKAIYLDTGLLVWLAVGMALAAIAAGVAIVATDSLKVFRNL
jgi:hypothetical protein